MGDRRQPKKLHETGDAISACLLAGGMVVTASDRAARALSAAFHRDRRAEGLAAWPTPRIVDERTFLQTAWQERSRDNLLLLNPSQEESLWAEIVAGDAQLSTCLEGPQHRIARLAMEAHDRLCAFAPNCLNPAARSAWQQDAAAFSGWLERFDDQCLQNGFLSPSRLPLALLPLLKAGSAPRPPLLLAGFDRLLPQQRRLFDAWGAWQELPAAATAQENHFHAAASPSEELTACALWCARKLAANPEARLLVLTRNAAADEYRGQLERAFLQHLASNSSSNAPGFEFSMGQPLSRTPLVRGAALLLRWLAGQPLGEAELDWLFACEQLAASPADSSALLGRMRALRRRSQEQPEWTLAAFLHHPGAGAPLPASWLEGITAARSRLAAISAQPRSPLAWAEEIPALLATAHWPGYKPLSSAAFQTLRSWRQAVETAGSHGFDGRRIRASAFLDALNRVLEQTLFAPETHDAPILIAGPAEAAGLTADALWFLGADEDSWPGSGPTHPLLPFAVQRDAGMPHASAQLDFALARAVTLRLLASAPAVHFSYSRQRKSADARPSRLIAQLAGAPQPLPPELKALPLPLPQTILFADATRVPFPPGNAPGGSSVLTAQSQCPFRAFATARLGAQGWQPAQAGLTASQRGQLLHSTLHSIWAGPPDGLHSLADLERVADREAFTARHIDSVFAAKIAPELRARMPRRYLELEALRLCRLITAWLEFETTRAAFEVAGTELDRTVSLAGLTLKLRLDRLDRLNDETVLVIDYKTGNVHPKSWNLPRPEDVQLPLYAGFALDKEAEILGGLVYAKIRPGAHEFAGCVADAKATLLPSLGGAKLLVKEPLTAEQLIDWSACIEELAKDFIAGRAEVDPREAPQTCKRCGLEALCRIREASPASGDDDVEDEDE
jgi:probable DNA repair protein